MAQVRQVQRWWRETGWLLVAPIVFFTLALSVGQQKGSYWLATRSDPEYIYLLNALNIANLQPPGYIDHPGTPVHLMGAIVLRFTNLVRGLVAPTTGFTESVLQQPELYLTVFNLVILVLMAGLIALVGFVAFRWCHQYLPSISLQWTPLLMATPLASANRVNPEPVLFCISQCLVVLLLFYLHQENLEKHRRFAVCLGVLVGLGLATKVTYLPVLLVIALLPTMHLQLIMVLVTIATGFVCTLPIAYRYGDVISWLLSIFLHTGNYGYGEAGIINLETVLPNVVTMLKADPGVFIVPGSAVILWICLQRYQQRSCNTTTPSQTQPSQTQPSQTQKSHRLSIVLLLICAGQLLMAVKHPVPLLDGDVELRYLMPAIALSGLLLYCQLQLAQQLLSSTQRIAHIMLLLVVLCVCITAHQSWYALQASITYRNNATAIDRQLNDQFPTCLVASYYRSSSPEFALWFGNGYANEAYANTLATLYPSQLFYHLWRQTFESFASKVKNSPAVLDELLKQPCFLLRGSPMSVADQRRHFPTISLVPVISTSSEVVYKLE
jgi:hypothetical protein